MTTKAKWIMGFIGLTIAGMLLEGSSKTQKDEQANSSGDTKAEEVVPVEVLHRYEYGVHWLITDLYKNEKSLRILGDMADRSSEGHKYWNVEVWDSRTMYENRKDMLEEGELGEMIINHRVAFYEKNPATGKVFWITLGGFDQNGDPKDWIKVAY